MIREVADGIVIRNKRLLVVKKKNTFILPGGKPGARESDDQCLEREFAEELSGTKIKVDLFYRMFRGISPNKKEAIDVRCYFVNILGSLGEPSAEIKESFWANTSNRLSYSEVTRKAIDSLHRDGYID
jgi:ADP-ribose pyrophosphatase YjhB (NUDIX family)